MINKSQFQSLNYNDKKDYLLDLLKDLPDNFKISHTILNLLQKHSPSENFLLSVFDQLWIMEKKWIEATVTKNQSVVSKSQNIVENYNKLSEKDKEDAEAYLLESLKNL